MPSYLGRGQFLPAVPAQGIRGPGGRPFLFFFRPACACIIRPDVEPDFEDLVAGRFGHLVKCPRISVAESFASQPQPQGMRGTWRAAGTLQVRLEHELQCRSVERRLPAISAPTKRRATVQLRRFRGAALPVKSRDWDLPGLVAERRLRGDQSPSGGRSGRRCRMPLPGHASPCRNMVSC